MDGMAEAGFTEGVNIVYILRNAEGDMTVNASICEYFVSLKPDLILSITTPCSQAMKAAVEGTTIPCVFQQVTDPVTAGIVPSWTESAPYFTGVSDWTDVPSQVAFMMEVMPDLKNLGIIYNAGEVNSVVQRDELVEKEAPKQGLTVVEGTAASTADVYAAAMSLVGRVQAIWIPTDNTAFAAFDSIIKVCEENDIALFGSTQAMAEAGAGASAGLNQYMIGKQAAVMAAKILKGEATPGDIPPEKCSYYVTVVNLPAAERMGMTIPQAVIDTADIVITE
jgi:putative ABC transport system substrate-binding protein